VGMEVQILLLLLLPLPLFLPLPLLPSLRPLPPTIAPTARPQFCYYRCCSRNFQLLSLHPASSRCCCLLPPFTLLSLLVPLLDHVNAATTVVHRCRSAGPSAARSPALAASAVTALASHCSGCSSSRCSSSCRRPCCKKSLHQLPNYASTPPSAAPILPTPASSAVASRLQSSVTRGVWYDK